MSLDRTHKRVCHLTTGILIPPWHFLSWQSNRDYVPTRESLNVKRMKVKQKHRKQKQKALGSPPQRVGILCNPTQMWFILHLNTQAANALSSRKQSSMSTIRKPPTAQKKKKLSAAVRKTNWQRETQATADLLIHTWLCWHTTHNAIWRYILWPMPRSATTQGCFSSMSTFTADGHWWKLRLFNHLSQQAVRKWERER